MQTSPWKSQKCVERNRPSGVCTESSSQVYRLLLRKFDRTGRQAVCFDDFIQCCLVMQVSDSVGKNNGIIPRTPQLIRFTWGYVDYFYNRVESLHKLFPHVCTWMLCRGSLTCFGVRTTPWPARSPSTTRPSSPCSLIRRYFKPNLW